MHIVIIKTTFLNVLMASVITLIQVVKTGIVQEQIVSRILIVLLITVI
jgi:hypothetical protein